MDGPTIVAGLSVIVAGVTSVGAPFITGRNQREGEEARFAFEIGRAEQIEIRALLDEGAVCAYELAHSVERLDSAFARRMQTVGQIRGEVADHRKTLGHLHARMHVRVGQTSAPSKLDDFIVAVTAVIDLIDGIHNAGEPPEQLLEGLTARKMGYWVAYWDYIGAAQALAGMTTVQSREGQV